MSGLGDMKSSYPGVAELTRQLDQEKISMLSNRVDDLRSQNEELKVRATVSVVSWNGNTTASSIDPPF